MGCGRDVGGVEVVDREGLISARKGQKWLGRMKACSEYWVGVVPGGVRFPGLCIPEVEFSGVVGGKKKVLLGRNQQSVDVTVSKGKGVERLEGLGV